MSRSRRGVAALAATASPSPPPPSGGGGGFRRSVAALAATAGFGAAAFSGCGDSGGGTSRAPTAPAPNPIAAVVSFGAASAEAYEGETVSIPIRYEARTLSSAWRLRVSPLPGTAESADFSLPNPIVEIPAGSGTSGEVTLDLTALPDDRFEEGTETLSLRLVPDPTVNAQLGGDLPVSLREGGVLMSFGPDPVEVTEGESTVVPVRYEVRNLPSSLRLGLSALAGTAADDDFVLDGDSFVVPAGRGVTGTASVTLSATRDGLFSEEDETGSLRLLPPEPRPPGVRLGAATEFVIREGGASPCPGLSIRALPPVVLEPGPGTFDEGLLSTTLTLTQEPSASDAVLFQRSPYLLTEALVERGLPSVSVLNFARWRTEAAGSATEHSVDLRWPGEYSLEEPNLEFGFLGNACSGDTLATCSATGCELTTTDPVPPTAALGTPGGLTASATGPDFIEFAWETVEGATGYEIQMSLTRGDFSTTTAATTAVTRHRFPVAPETTAYARVRALAGNTVSDWSAVVTANNRTTPSLGIPRGLRVSATASDFIEFAWDAVEGATGYEIQLSLTPGDFSTVSAATVTGTQHLFPVASETTAYARVRAMSAGIVSDWSEVVTGNSRAPTVGVPGGLRVSDAGTDFIEFAWEAVEAATGYEIQMSLTEGDFGIASAATVTTTLHRFTVDPETTAYARVRALSGNLVSEWSAAVSGSSEAAPSVLAAPRPRVSATGPDFIEWNWDAVPDARLYQVQVATTVDGLHAAALLATTRTFHRVTASHDETLYLRVRAIAGAESSPVASDWSEVATGTSEGAPTVGVPGGLRVSATAADFVEFSWHAVEGATGYEIQTSLIEDDFSIASAATVTTTLHRFPVDPETTVYARVRAFSGSLVSDWSDAVSGSSNAAPLILALAPPLPRVSATGPDFIEWSWDAVPDAVAYQIRVAPTADEIYAAAPLVTANTFHRVPATLGQTLYLRVRAIAGTDSSPVVSDWSSAVSGTAR